MKNDGKAVKNENFGPAFERYRTIRRVRLKAATLDQEADAHREFWKFLQSSHLASDELAVTREHLRAYAEHQFKRTDIARNTARNKVYKLKHFYEEAARQGWLARSSWVDLELPKVEKNPIEVLSVKQMKEFLEMPDLTTAKGLRDRALFELMYSAALRVSDIISLTADSFQEEYRLLRVTGKGDKEAVLPVGKMAAHFVRFYAEEIFPRINTLGGRPLFISIRTGEPLTKNTLGQIVGGYGKKFPSLGNRFLGTHVFRYSACTHLADEGVDIRLIQEFMRHDKPSTTMRYVSQSYQKLQQVFQDTHPRS